MSFYICTPRGLEALTFLIIPMYNDPVSSTPLHMISDLNSLWQVSLSHNSPSSFLFSVTLVIKIFVKNYPLCAVKKQGYLTVKAYTGISFVSLQGTYWWEAKMALEKGPFPSLLPPSNATLHRGRSGCGGRCRWSSSRVQSCLLHVQLRWGYHVQGEICPPGHQSTRTFPGGITASPLVSLQGATWLLFYFVSTD